MLVESAWGVFRCAQAIAEVSSVVVGFALFILLSFFGFCLFLFAFFGDYIMCRFSRGTKDAAFLALTIGE